MQLFESIFQKGYRIFPCNLVGLTVCIYIVFYVILKTRKFLQYRNEFMHWFLFDFCYWVNAALCLLLIVSVVDISTSSSKYGFSLFGSGYYFDIKPFGLAMSQMSEESKSLYIFFFFGLMSATLGPVLWAIPVMDLAAVFHSYDKMINCYVHLAPAIVQVILLQNEFLATADSNSHRSKAQRELMESCFSYWYLLKTHLTMFLIWQFFYHTVFETRALMRKSKAKKLMNKSNNNNNNNNNNDKCSSMSERMTSYTWWSSKPPGGKSGLPYRFLTMFGEQEYKMKFMFSVIQLVVHLVTLSAAYVPMYLSYLLWDAWPLFLYVAFFFVVSIRNAAIVFKRMIQKSQKKDDDDLKKE